MAATDPRRRPQHLQRVPPHDLDTERALIGAALVWPQAAHVLVDTVQPSAFYAPQHQTIATAIVEVAAEGLPVDANTVASQLRRQGLLDTIGTTQAAGPAELGRLMTLGATAGATPRLADDIIGYHHRRQVLAAASEVVEAVYTGGDLAGLATALHATSIEQQAGRESCWTPINLAAVLAGEGNEDTPAILTRDDGQHLLYPGRIHTLAADSESGKSWLCFYACHQQLNQGQHAIYIDFEDNQVGAVNRLLALGTPPATIIERFHYIRPDQAFDAAADAHLAGLNEATHPTIAIIDGVTEALSLTGANSNSDVDIAALYHHARQLARHGTAVTLVDHVPKDPTNRAGPTGSQHKRAGIDGAGLSLEVLQPFGKNRTGRSRILILKDRHGALRGVAHNARNLGELVITSTPDGVTIALTPPPTADTTFRPTVYMERISRFLEEQPEGVSGRTIETAVSGKAPVLRTALEQLIAEGRVARFPGPKRAFIHTSRTPFRHTDPTTQSDQRGDDQRDDQPF